MVGSQQLSADQASIGLLIERRSPAVMPTDFTFRPLDVGEVFVGRSAHNHVTLPDTSVSTRHARLIVNADHCQVEDLGSVNGIFLDRQRVPAHRRTPFPPGSILTIGPYEMFLTRDLSQRYEVTRESTDRILSRLVRSSLGLTSESLVTPTLTIIAGAQLGRVLPLSNRQPDIQIGRHDLADLPLSDPDTSRDHLHITLEEGRWLLRDRQSKNGTFLNGVCLNAPHYLMDGDLIRLGTTILIYRDPALPLDRNQKRVAEAVQPSSCDAFSAEAAPRPSGVLWKVAWLAVMATTLLTLMYLLWNV